MRVTHALEAPIERDPHSAIVTFRADEDDRSALTTLSWWDCESELLAYIQSSDDRRPRIPTGSGAARPAKFEQVAT